MSRRGKLAVAGSMLTACAAFVLAGCGNDSQGARAGAGQQLPQPPAAAGSPGSVNLGAHNDADISFARHMIAHHEQALAMVRLVGSRAQDAKVKDLASRIEKAQDPEIARMSQWLAEWRQPLSPSAAAPQSSGADDRDDDHANMPGMLSREQMRDLEEATGEEFDDLFLDMMIKHHEGAVAMANEVKAKGGYQPAKQLAETIIATQTSEIREMRELRGSR